MTNIQKLRDVIIRKKTDLEKNNPSNDPWSKEAQQIETLDWVLRQSIKL